MASICWIVDRHRFRFPASGSVRPQDAEDVPKLNYEAPNILKVMQGLAAEALNKGLAHYGVSEGEDSISSNRCRTRVASSR
jgi:hypothetical protein